MNHKFVIAFVVLAVSFAAVSANVLLTTSAYESHGDVEWRTDFDEAQRVATEQDRPLLVYFRMENCGSCEEFDRRLKRADLDRQLDRFVRVSVRAPKRPSLASRFGVERTPALVVVAEDGTAVARIVPTKTESLRSSLDRAHSNWKQERDG